MATLTPETIVRSRVEIKIPDSAYDTYERLAKVEKKTIDQVMSERLTDCQEHNAVQGLWFNDADRQSIEVAMGSKVASPRDVVDLISKATRIKVGPADVKLPPHTLERLHSRCHDPNFSRWCTELVERLLTQYSEGQW